MLQQHEIIMMARQVGYTPFEALKWERALTNFAKLVRDDYSFTHAQLWLNRIDEAVKAEREACAKLCVKLTDDWLENHHPVNYAKAIRARGEA